MSTVCLIPVKDLAQAKARLAPVLDEAGRRELVLAMLRDVLAAATGCAAIDAVAVVSRDGDALAVAREAGAQELPEPGGLNEALESAARRMAEGGATRVLVVAADLPLARAEQLEAVLSATSDVTIAPAHDGGTNALVSAPGTLAYQFGASSATQHLDGARATALSVAEIDDAALALDIDTPEDLESLRGVVDRAGAHTRAALERLGLAATDR